MQAQSTATVRLEHLWSHKLVLVLRPADRSLLLVATSSTLRSTATTPLPLLEQELSCVTHIRLRPLHPARWPNDIERRERAQPSGTDRSAISGIPLLQKIGYTKKLGYTEKIAFVMELLPMGYWPPLLLQRSSCGMLATAIFASLTNSKQLYIGRYRHWKTSTYGNSASVIDLKDDLPNPLLVPGKRLGTS